MAKKQGLSRKKTALIAAEMSIWSDARMLGIPTMREALVKMAARKAMGAEVNVDKFLWGFTMSSDNYLVVKRAFYNAVASAEVSIRGLAL